jgi:elongation factor P
MNHVLVVEVAPLTKHAAQYSWLEGSDFVFMDSNSYEEVRVPIADVDAASYISDSVDVTLLKYEDRVLNVELPTHALYEVLDISTSGSAKLSTALGTKIIVPAFVEVGQTIKVNTSTGVFVERA